MNDRLASVVVGNEGAEIASPADDSARASALLAQIRAIPDPAQTTDHLDRVAEFGNELLTIKVPSADLIDAIFEVFTRLFHGCVAPRVLLRFSELAVDLARASDDLPRLRRALSLDGNARITIDDLSGAAGDLCEALEVASRIDLPGAASGVWINVGVLFQQLSQFRTSIACFLQAVDLAAKSERFRAVVPLAWTDIAVSAMHLRDTDSGLNAVQRALAIMLHPNEASDQLARVLAEHALVRLLFDSGRMDELAQWPQPLALPSELPHKSAAWLFAEMTAGLLDVHQSRADSGAIRLARCVELTKTEQRRYYPEAVSSLIVALEFTGQTDAALVHLHDMQAVLRAYKSQQVSIPLPPGGQHLTPAADDAEFEALLVSRAVGLERDVATRLGDLLTCCITGCERSGHDRFHVYRVARLSELFSESIGWGGERSRAIGFATRYMDAGMSVVPEPVLRKPRALSNGERKLLFEHTQFGGELLENAHLELLRPVIPIARFHHEWWDGSGPWGLRGAAIPLEARLVGICDAFEGLTHDRPWRKAMKPPAALRTIEQEGGTHFEPELVTRFVAFMRDLYWQHDDLDQFLASDADDNSYLRARDRIEELLARKPSNGVVE